jgi:sialidase-1
MMKITKMDLFTAREGGYWNYRIPCLAATATNVLLAGAEARPNHGMDYDDNDLVLRRSRDGGVTFDPPTIIVHQRDFGKGPAHNLVLVPDVAEHLVVALFCYDYAQIYAMISQDDGASFSTPREITPVLEGFRGHYPWRVCATGPGHGLQLRNGRLVVPVWLSDGSGDEFGPQHRGHRPSAVASLVSDDHGTTWQRGEIVCRHGDLLNKVAILNPSETAAVELSDGRVMVNIRNDSHPHRRLVAISPDGASSWQLQGFDPALIEPACMASMVSLDWPNGQQPGKLLFANPACLDNQLIPPGTLFAHDRANLTIRLSRNDGRTWPVKRRLEPGPSAYSDLALLPDGTICCLYECGMVDHMFDPHSLRLAKFDLQWLLEK